jgi:predicted PurR-regulated permease PerM
MSFPKMLLAALTGLALYLCYLLAEPFLLAIATAAVLAVLFYPLYGRSLRLIRQQDAAALIATILTLLIVVVPALLVGWAAVEEIRGLYDKLSQRRNADGGWLAYVDAALSRFIDWAAPRAGLAPEQLRSEILLRLQSLGAWLLRGATAGAARLTGGIAEAAITFVTLFFFLRDGPQMVRRIAGWLPLADAQVQELCELVSRTVVANMYGVIAVAAAQGLLAGLGIWWVGLPSPVLWGLLAAVFSLVPLIGSGIVWVPAAIILFVSGHWGKGLFLTVWGTGVVAMIDNFIRPWIVSGRTHLNPLLVFFGLLGGVSLFGPVGVFLGPVLVSVTAALLEMWARQEQG